MKNSAGRGVCYNILRDLRTLHILRKPNSISFQSFYLDIFSCHTLWLFFFVLPSVGFLIVQ